MVGCQCVVERWWAIKGEIGDLIIVGRILTRNGAGFLSHSLFIRLIPAGLSKAGKISIALIIHSLDRSAHPTGSGAGFLSQSLSIPLRDLLSRGIYYRLP